MRIIEAHISGNGQGPFAAAHRGSFGKNHAYELGPFASGLTLTIVVKADEFEENKLKHIEEKIKELVG